MTQKRNQTQPPRRHLDPSSTGENHEPELISLNSVTCANFEEHIHTLLDQRAPLLEDALLQRHAAECEPCTLILADYETLDDSVSQISVETLSRLAGVNLAGPPIEKRKRRQRRSELARTLPWIIAVTAALMVAIGIGAMNINQSSIQLSQLPIGPQATTSTIEEMADDRPAVEVPSIVRNTPSESIALISRPTAAAPIANSNRVPRTPTLRTNTIPLPVTDRESQFPRIRTAALLVAFDQSEIDMIEPYLNPVETMRLKNVASWNRLTKSLDPISPYLRMSVELPGFRSLHDSLNVTLNLIQQTLFSQEPSIEQVPDVSQRFDRSATV